MIQCGCPVGIRLPPVSTAATLYDVLLHISNESPSLHQKRESTQRVNVIKITTLRNSEPQ